MEYDKSKKSHDDLKRIYEEKLTQNDDDTHQELLELKKRSEDELGALSLVIKIIQKDMDITKRESERDYEEAK